MWLGLEHRTVALSILIPHHLVHAEPCANTALHHQGPDIGHVHQALMLTKVDVKHFILSLCFPYCYLSYLIVIIDYT